MQKEQSDGLLKPQRAMFLRVAREYLIEVQYVLGGFLCAADQISFLYLKEFSKRNPKIEEEDKRLVLETFFMPGSHRLFDISINIELHVSSGIGTFPERKDDFVEDSLTLKKRSRWRLKVQTRLVLRNNDTAQSGSDK